MFRFSPEKNGWGSNGRNKSGSFTDSLAVPLEKITYNTVVRQLINLDRVEKPNKLTARVSFWLIGIICEYYIISFLIFISLSAFCIMKRD